MTDNRMKTLTTQETALDKAYREKKENIARMLEGIRGKLEETDANINWAHVGSLGHVEELLRELDEFL